MFLWAALCLLELVEPLLLLLQGQQWWLQVNAANCKEQIGYYYE
jgi:hypothetical protein